MPSKGSTKNPLERCETLGKANFIIGTFFGKSTVWIMQHFFLGFLQLDCRLYHTHIHIHTHTETSTQDRYSFDKRIFNSIRRACFYRIFMPFNGFISVGTNKCWLVLHKWKFDMWNCDYILKHIFNCSDVKAKPLYRFIDYAVNS